jgi:hypothetical protein
MRNRTLKKLFVTASLAFLFSASGATQEKPLSKPEIAETIAKCNVRLIYQPELKLPEDYRFPHPFSVAKASFQEKRNRAT